MKRPWLWFAAILPLHLALSVGFFLWSYVLSSARFDGRPVAAWQSQLADGLLALFWFPVARPLMRLLPLPGVLGWLPVVLNSALCALLVVLVIRHFWARRRA